MKLQALFQRAIEIGIEADPRGKKGVAKLLARQKKTLDGLSGFEKELFDTERLWNPYADSRMLHGTGNEEVKTLMVGIDIETPELLLAHKLNANGAKIDAVFIHHPEGRALGDLTKVMPVQVDIYGELGVPVNRSEALLAPTMKQIHRSIHSQNIFRAEQAAQLLDIPCFCCHNATDHLAWRFMRKEIASKEYDNLESIVNALLDIPEFKHYAKKGNPPTLVHGSQNTRPGTVRITGFNGGTNGSKHFITELSRAGVGTIVCMHASEEEVKLAEKHHLNIVQCSHMAADSMGINLLLDHFKGIEIIEAAGFVRIKR